MPRKYVLEMFCDMNGAGLAYAGEIDTPEYYDRKKDEIKLHDNAREYFEALIGNYLTKQPPE